MIVHGLAWPPTSSSRTRNSTRFSHTCGSPGRLADSAPVVKPVGSAPEGKRFDVVEAHVLGFGHHLLQDLANAFAFGAAENLDTAAVDERVVACARCGSALWRAGPPYSSDRLNSPGPGWTSA